MALSDPFNDLAAGAVGAVPGGSADGFIVSAAGTVSFTTLKGSAIVAMAVVAGQHVHCRLKSIEALAGGAVIYLGYHKA